MIPSIMGTTYIPNVIESVEFGRKPPMDAEELLVHDGSEGKGAERVHTGIIQAFGVLSLTRESRFRGFTISSNVLTHTQA